MATQLPDCAERPRREALPRRFAEKDVNVSSCESSVLVSSILEWSREYEGRCMYV
jgi:hypothetical protein